MKQEERKGNMEKNYFPRSCVKCSKPFNDIQIMTIMTAPRIDGAEIIIRCVACKHIHHWSFRES